MSSATFRPNPAGFAAMEETIGEGLFRVAQQIVRDATPNVPRLSGRTAASGFAVAYVNGREVASDGTHGPAPDTSGVVAYAGFTGPLAHLLETGTKPRVQKGGRATGRITRQPFLGPAAQRVGRQAASIIKGAG